jgi:hypothetical protein
MFDVELTVEGRIEDRMAQAEIGEGPSKDT